MIPYHDLTERVEEARARIAAAVARGGHGQNVRIIAVTKTHGPDAADAAWHAGIQDVGENRVQEMEGKMAGVVNPVRWHLIGHLQRNKVKALEKFSLFHALDSERLADAVNRQGVERGRAVDVLVQANVTGEGSKGGFTHQDLRGQSERMRALAGLRIQGVMTMARMGAGEQELHETFAAARSARQLLVEAGHPATELSMGMSGDYEIAVEEGATMVRLGTTLFGARGT